MRAPSWQPSHGTAGSTAWSEGVGKLRTLCVVPWEDWPTAGLRWDWEPAGRCSHCLTLMSSSVSAV